MLNHARSVFPAAVTGADPAVYYPSVPLARMMPGMALAPSTLMSAAAVLRVVQSEFESAALMRVWFSNVNVGVATCYTSVAATYSRTAFAAAWRAALSSKAIWDNWDAYP